MGLRWIAVMIGRWESANRKRRLERQLELFQAACRVDGDPVLDELVGLVFTAWDEGWGPDALDAIFRAAREQRRRAS